MEASARFRIGELAYRVGVSADLLRAWERRYGLLRPIRSEGGYRLYSERDEWRVRLMQQKLWSGLSAAEAAREVARIEGDAGPAEGAVETPTSWPGSSGPPSRASTRTAPTSSSTGSSACTGWSGRSATR